MKGGAGVLGVGPRRTLPNDVIGNLFSVHVLILQSRRWRRKALPRSVKPSLSATIGPER